MRRLCAAAAALAAVATVAAAPSGAAARTGASTIQVTATSDNLHWHLTRLRDVRFAATEARGARTIDVDDSVRYQRFQGVGGAMTDSSAWLIYDELAPR